MILTVNEFDKYGYGISDMLYYMGAVSLFTTQKRAILDLSENVKSVIILNSDSLTDKSGFAEIMRSYTDAPIFAISDSPEYDDRYIFDKVFILPLSAPEILDEIRRYSVLRGLAPPAEYKTEKINASIDSAFPKFSGEALPFTKTETMILRTFISHHPSPLKAERILKCAFRKRRMPDLSCVRTHISIMNRKFREIYGKNLICQSSGKGYQLALF